MNILVITTEFGHKAGGLALACTRLVDILKQEHEVHVIISTEAPIHTASGCINPHIEDRIRKEYKLKEDYWLHRHSDIIIAFGGGWNGYYASLLSGQTESPLILALRGSDINLAKWSAEEVWYFREATRRACKVVCLSQEMLQNATRLCPEIRGKSLIIPNPIDSACPNIKEPDLSKGLTIGTAAGYLNEKKGIGNLLRMLAVLQSTSSLDIRLELVGKIDSALHSSYLSEVENLGLQAKIVFHGYRSRQELKTIMQSWDFYIQASVCEGHPNAVIESLSCGTAFISSQTGYIAEQLQPLFPEFFFESFRPESMAKRLLDLCQQTGLSERYQQAHKILLHSCAEQQVALRWLDTLATLRRRPTNTIDCEHLISVALHDVLGSTHDSITTPVEVFRGFVEFIANKGYGLCSMRDYRSMSQEERRHWIVCTFDDGYRSLTQDAMQILKAHNFTATVFVCTGLLGQDNSWNNKDPRPRTHLSIEDSATLHRAGWEIASHGVLHRNLLKLNDADIEYELSQSQTILSELFGQCDTYSYPYGAYNRFIQTCVGRYYDYAFAVDSGGTSLVADRYQLRRYTITEIYQILNSNE